MNPIKTTTLAASLAIGLLSMGAGQAQNAADVVTEQRQLAAFKRIQIDGPYKVTIKAEGAQSVALTGRKDQLAEIATRINGDTLIIGSRQQINFRFSIGKKHERVTIAISAPMLASLKSSGSGDVDVEHVSGERFNIQADGPGNVRASGSARELNAGSTGSGDLNLERFSATNVKLAMSGPGDVAMMAINGDFTIDASGSGDLRAIGLQAARVAARMDGPGDVTLTGAARELALEVHGSGDFSGCALSVESASASLHGPGEGCVSGKIKALEAQVHGSGDLTVHGLVAQKARLALSGPGNVKLDGAVGVLTADVSGSGDVDGQNLNVTNAVLKSSGPGGIRLATVTGALDARLTGSGGLLATMEGKRLALNMDGPGMARIGGRVESVKVEVHGSGELDGRGLAVSGSSDVVVDGVGGARIGASRFGRGTSYSSK